MVKTAEALLQQELGAARAGTHQRQKSEEKRLSLLKIQKLKKAEQTHQSRVAAVEARFEEQKREVCARAPPNCEDLRPIRSRCATTAGRRTLAAPSARVDCAADGACVLRECKLLPIATAYCNT